MSKESKTVPATESTNGTVIFEHFNQCSSLSNPEIQFIWEISNVSAWIAAIKRQSEWDAFSPVFPSAPSSSKWKLLFRIDKSGWDDKEKISLYLCPMSGRKKVEVFFIFIFRNNIYRPFVGKESFYFTPEDEFLGYKRFYDLEKLLNISGPRGDKIYFDCYLTVTEEVELIHDLDGVQRMHVANAKLNASMGMLLEMDKFGDVQLMVGKRKFKAYKGILAARSTVFADMFNARSINRFEIPDMEPEVFAELLRFIYTDRVSNLDGLKYKLLVAAHRFNVESLKQLCQDATLMEESNERFSEALQAGSACEAPVVKRRGLELFAKGVVGFTQTPGWKELVSAHPNLADEAIELLVMLANDAP